MDAKLQHRARTEPGPYALVCTIYYRGKRYTWQQSYNIHR